MNERPRDRYRLAGVQVWHDRALFIVYAASAAGLAAAGVLGVLAELSVPSSWRLLGRGRGSVSRRFSRHGLGAGLVDEVERRLSGAAEASEAGVGDELPDRGLAGLGAQRVAARLGQGVRDAHQGRAVVVDALLARRGERIHPASAFLASESRHLEGECAEHDLHMFAAARRMDEILISNFMVFSDLVADEHYDLWVGDEAWDVDYFLHENPELKRAPYAWLTDFVGWLPMPDGGDSEAELTADYNAEMIEQIGRFPRLRDRAVFVGNPGDVVPDRFGAGLPPIRDWVGQHYQFAGYISGYDPATVADTAAIRAELGYRPDEKVCLVTVGGSGVGADLLRRAVAAYPAAKRLVPELRMIVVAGPRIDPATLPAHDGLELHGYVHDLYRQLAACDLAVVQGGLTTTMELTAARRPFIYVPLRHHFEQNFHVRHRLDRYRAGRRLDYQDTEPESLAQVIAEEIGRPVSYRPVEIDGAARAAACLAELI